MSKWSNALEFDLMQSMSLQDKVAYINNRIQAWTKRKYIYLYYEGGLRDKILREFMPNVPLLYVGKMEGAIHLNRKSNVKSFKHVAFSDYGIYEPHGCIVGDRRFYPLSFWTDLDCYEWKRNDQ